MVNICDTFTRMYGRKPSADELGSLMKMKAEQDAFKNAAMKPKLGVMGISGPSQERSKAAAAKRHPHGARVIPQRACIINNLLDLGLLVDEIAEALYLDEAKIRADIDKFNLPRRGLKPKR
jgi:hypothetical protein